MPKRSKRNHSVRIGLCEYPSLIGHDVNQGNLVSLLQLTGAAMFRITDESPDRPDGQAQFETCLHCSGRLTQVESFLNARVDKPVRIFKCADCQKLAWDD